MKKTSIIVSLLLLLFVPFLINAQNSEEICEFVGAIATETVASGALASCFVSQASCPVAVEIAHAAMICAENPACQGLSEKIVSEGCVYLVKKTGNMIEIIGKASSESRVELYKTYQFLQSVEGIRWLMANFR